LKPGATFNAACTMKGKEGKSSLNSPTKHSVSNNEPAKAPKNNNGLKKCRLAVWYCFGNGGNYLFFGQGR